MSEHKIIVLNLPYTCDKDALFEHFKECGEVSDAVITDKESGKSRGFGFVTFTNEAAVNKALEKAGSDLNGRPIRVKKATDKPKREDMKEKKQRFQKESRPAKEFNDTNKVIVNSLAWATDDDSLRAAFSKFGELAECMVLKDRSTGKSRGRGIVRFETEEAMNQAIAEMNGSELDGRTIVVRQFLPKSELSANGKIDMNAPKSNKQISFDEPEEKKEVEEKKAEEEVKAVAEKEESEEKESEEESEKEESEEKESEEESEEKESEEDSDSDSDSDSE